MAKTTETSGHLSGGGSMKVPSWSFQTDSKKEKKHGIINSVRRKTAAGRKMDGAII